MLILGFMGLLAPQRISENNEKRTNTFHSGFLAVKGILPGRLDVVERTAWRGARGGRHDEACYL